MEEWEKVNDTFEKANEEWRAAWRKVEEKIREAEEATKE